MRYFVGVSTLTVFRKKTIRAVLCAVGVSTPIVFREEILRAVRYGCEHTYSIQRRNLMCGTLWV